MPPASLPTPLPLALHRATPADAARFALVARETFLEAFAATTDPANMAVHLARAFGEAQQRRELEDPAVTVLAVREAEGDWGGFVMLRTGTTADGLRARQAIEVARFYVRSRWHGRGVAQFLMDAAVAEAVARGHDGVWLQVWEHNARARRFYEKCGFLPVGTKPFLMGDEWEDDLVYERLT